MTDDEPSATILATEILARTSFSTLFRSTVAYRRQDGRRQEFFREAYDHGDGAAILLHDPTRDRVLLVRQWRFGVQMNPPDGARGRDLGWFIEVPAGMVDGRDPAAAVIAEAQEEVGVTVGQPEHVASCYMSPGSITERVHLFVASYTTADRSTAGGGLAAEGEDIESLEPTVDEALAMVRGGQISDAKTVLLLWHLRLSGRSPGGVAG